MSLCVTSPNLTLVLFFVRKITFSVLSSRSLFLMRLYIFEMCFLCGRLFIMLTYSVRICPYVHMSFFSHVMEVKHRLVGIVLGRGKYFGYSACKQAQLIHVLSVNH